VAKRTKVTVTVEDRDHGYKKLAASLGDMGTITLGVQGKEAEEPHAEAGNSRYGGPSGLTKGQVAAIHELGLGVRPRSWLRKWMDTNESRMLAQTKAAFQEVMAGKTTRNKALQELGYEWTQELRDEIWEGKITPPLEANTVARKGGESRPLLETGDLMNAITYKVFLPQAKSIRNTLQRAAVRKQKL
jgi:hypothetical protein